MSQNALLDERDEAVLDEWYLEHLRCMVAVPGIFSAQRFKTPTAGFPGSLAIYGVTSEQAFDNDYYRSFRGMGVLASRIDERQHHVDLFEGLAAAPHVGETEVLLLADRDAPLVTLQGIAFTWLECVGRDFSTPWRGIAVRPGESASGLGGGIAVYRPVTGRFKGAA